MNVLHDIPPGPKVPSLIYVFVEIPMGSRNKYEYDKKLGLIKLDRVLYSPVHYPGDYGFVPQTLWDDGDPLDVLVITRFPVPCGTLIEARPIGAIEMIDNKEDDMKILAVNANNPSDNHIRDVKDLSPFLVEEIKHFFKVYKQLQKAEVEINKVLNREAAEKAILKGIKQYQKHAVWHDS